MKPIIGITPLWDEEKNSLWMLPAYLEGVEQAGGIPIVLPFSTKEEDIVRLASKCDGFIFTGGPDVDPKLYNEEPLKDLISGCQKRDELESVYLREALKDNKPILGICRGLQFINVFLGGNLYQDIPLQAKTEVNHRQDRPYDKPVHEVKLVENSPIYKCLGNNHIMVNSCHHQGIKELAPNLVSMASSEDGLIEAVYLPSHSFLWAVQWHPEVLLKTSEESAKIFAAFIDAAKKK